MGKKRSKQKPRGADGASALRKQKGFKTKTKAAAAAAAAAADRRAAKPATAPRRQLSALAREDALASLATILLIGEGDFGFGASLAHLRGSGVGILSTGFDTREACEEKYGDTAVTKHIDAVEAAGGMVIHGVDARRLRDSLGRQRDYVGVETLENGFDAIVFQFPHNGEGEKDQARNVDAHRKLLAAFFKECVAPMQSGPEARHRGGGPPGKGVAPASPLLASLESELHVTVKTGKPYDLWRVGELAPLATQGGLRLAKVLQFHASDFDGYEHRRTIGFNEHNNAHSEDVDDGGARRSVTYIFRRTR